MVASSAVVADILQALQFEKELLAKISTTVAKYFPPVCGPLQSLWTRAIEVGF